MEAQDPRGALRQLQAATDALEASALQRHEVVKQSRQTTAALGAQVAIMAAYRRRLHRLAALLRRYDAHMQQAMAGLGLAAAQGGQEQASHTGSALQAALRQLEQVEQALVAATLSDGNGVAAPDALLEVSSLCAPTAACIAAAGAGSILEALQGCVQADLETVDSWPAAIVPPSNAAGAEASPLSPAFTQLQLQQKERWQAMTVRQQQLELLQDEVAAAKQVLAGTDDSPTDDSSSNARQAAQVRLVAQKTGLQAELACLDGAVQQAQQAASVAAQRAQQLAGQQEELAGLERQEAALDAAIHAMCVADSRVMRQWRRGACSASEHVQAQLLSQRQPLLDLAEGLLDAQRRELAAFRASPMAAVVTGKGSSAVAVGQSGSAEQEQASPATVIGSVSGAATKASIAAAAQLLDPLAHLKTERHAEEVVQAAQKELQQLRPLRDQWTALAASSSTQLAELQATADQVQAEVDAFEKEVQSGPIEKLRQAAAAAQEGSELVGRVRKALAEWWTCPAIAATPWLKREGKTAEQWLQLLEGQRRTLRQREAFIGRDLSNSMR